MSQRKGSSSSGNSGKASSRASAPAAAGDGALPSFYTPGSGAGPTGAGAKGGRGPNRTSKATGKLKILPSEPAADAARPSAPGAGALRSADDSSSDDDAPSVRRASVGGADDDEEEYREQRNQKLAQIPEGSMRRDARRLTRKARGNLPRVTAYSTATSYRMRDLTRWLAARRDSHRTNPMTFDECVYTTYTYDDWDEAHGVPVSRAVSSGPPARNTANGSGGGGKSGDGGNGAGAAAERNAAGQQYGRTGDLLGIPELANEGEEDEESSNPAAAAASEASANGGSTTTLVDSENRDEDENGAKAAAAAAARQQQQQERERGERRERRRNRFSVAGATPEVFFMEYGTVVIWGMTLVQEKRLLRELRRFEVERLAPEDIESEDLNWYLADYSRIYNDVITLRRGSSYMTKLSLSHALAQSTKISFFEGVIDNTIDATKDIPQSIAESGKIGMPPAEIMKQIGHLFILRMNIHLVGSIVDSPEIFWAQPDLEPLYSAARSYLEIPQRIDLLNARVEVLQDMLQLLKDQVTSSHSEWLEIVVIGLILLEIILGIATMFVDLYFA